MTMHHDHKPYDYDQALRDVRASMTRTDKLTLHLVSVAEDYERHMARSFPAEQWPQLVRMMLLSAASLASIPARTAHLLPVVASNVTMIVLNVQACAAALLQDRIDAGGCSCGSPGTFSLNPGEVVVHGPDACRIAKAAGQ